MAVQFCKYCGKQLSEGDRRCPACGKELAQVCRACGAKLIEGARFCQRCGISLVSSPPPKSTVFCPKCGKENLPNSKFCQHCGVSLAPVPPPQSVTEKQVSEPKTSPNLNKKEKSHLWRKSKISIYMGIGFAVIAVFLFFLLRGGSPPALIGNNIQMTRLVRGNEISSNGFFSTSFSRDSEEYELINIAVDLNKDGVITSYPADGEMQEEWLVRNAHVRISTSEPNNYPILIPDKTIEERSDFPVYIALVKDELIGWDGRSASGVLIKEIKISNLERLDYGPYYTPDPDGVRAGGFPCDWLATGFAFADDSVPNFSSSTGAGSSVAESSQTQQTTFSVFRFDVPDLDQGKNECVPTSVANSLLWLAGKYDFFNKLPGDGPGIIPELKQDMKWTEKGVLSADVIPGLNAFARRHKLPIETHQVGEEYDPDIVEKIADELEKDHDVEIWLQYGRRLEDGSLDNDGAHLVTAVGAWRTATGQEFLGIHDPLSRGNKTLDIYEIKGLQNFGGTVIGRVMVDYAFQGIDLTLIRWAFAESPRSESETATESIYDGTYTGTFNYEYMDKDRFGDKVITPWTAGSFTLTLTFKTIEVSDDLVSLDVTNAIVSDPGFETGAGGVNPEGDFGGQLNARLPVNPAEQGGVNKYSYMTLVFVPEPYQSNRIEIPDGAIKVSPDGKTLSDNPDWLATLSGWTPSKTIIPSWTAKTRGFPEPGRTTTFLGYGTFGKSGVYDRLFKYGSWTLTKVSP